MTSWRTDLTVLTDLSASMFAACFMILLIFLSLVQQSEQRLPSPVDAGEALRLVQHQIETPGGLVDLLYAHDAPRDGTNIDIFADRVEIGTPTGNRNLRPAEIPAGFEGIAGPIRLYVFSNALYNAVIAALDGVSWREMSVPLALRSAEAPDRSWSTDFLALGAQPLDAAAFRQELARLIKGGPSPGGAGSRAAAQSGPADLLTRFNLAISVGLATLMPVLGLLAVVLIERRRWRL